jgi:hypothetical protein
MIMKEVRICTRATRGERKKKTTFHPQFKVLITTEQTKSEAFSAVNACSVLRGGGRGLNKKYIQENREG